MKNINTNAEAMKIVKNYAKNQFSYAEVEKLMVSENEQQKEIEKLRLGRRQEQFFFVVNVADFQIIHADGLEEIGFHSSTFDMNQYTQLLPSFGILHLLTILWKRIFEFAIEEKEFLSFLKPKFIVQIPFKNAKGEIMLVKRTISIFQYTNTGKLTQYLSEFTIIKYLFDSEAPEPRFTDIPPHLDKKIDAALNQSFVWEASPFSRKEMEILNAYVNDDGSKSAAELAKETGVTPATLKFYNKEILAHAKEFLGEIYKFGTAKEVAHFFKKCKVLN
jgi:hypothetical protein